MHRAALDNAATECFADRLVSQANAKHGYHGSKLSNDVDAASCIGRPAWARREDDRTRRQFFAAIDIDRIATDDRRFTAKPAKVPGQVVNE